jgi:hypothetical protein
MDWLSSLYLVIRALDLKESQFDRRRAGSCVDCTRRLPRLPGSLLGDLPLLWTRVGRVVALASTHEKGTALLRLHASDSLHIFGCYWMTRDRASTTVNRKYAATDFSQGHSSGYYIVLSSCWWEAWVVTFGHVLDSIDVPRIVLLRLHCWSSMQLIVQCRYVTLYHSKGVTLYLTFQNTFNFRRGPYLYLLSVLFPLPGKG